MAKKQQIQLTDLLKTSGWQLIGSPGYRDAFKKRDYAISVGVNRTIIKNQIRTMEVYAFNTKDIDMIIQKIKELKLWAV